MKEACAAVGVATPAYVMASTPEEVEQAIEKLRFPLFVKHYSSYASVDISRRSRVRTPEGLRIQAKKIISRHGTALIEEFIEGIECTVLIAENPEDPKRPIAYTPVQYQFPKGEDFKHEKLKWVEYEGLATIPVDDPILASRLKEECSRFFLELDASSFARCDVWVSRDGTPYVLEINANCGIYYPPADYGSADLCLTHDPAGHVGFTRTLVKAAFARHARANITEESTTEPEEIPTASTVDSEEVCMESPTESEMEVMESPIESETGGMESHPTTVESAGASTRSPAQDS